MSVVIGTNSGFVTSSPSADPAGTNSGGIDYLSLAQSDVPPAGTVVVSDMGWYCDNATEEANFQLGIYSHNGATGRPNVRLAVTGDIAKGTAAGWKTGSLSYTLPTTDGTTTYWVAFQLDDTSTTTVTNYTAATGYNMAYQSNTTALADPFVYSNGVTNRAYSVYALYSVSTSGQPTAKRWGGVPYMALNKGVW